MRKLEQGSGKYKGNIPFKYFTCENVGHFASKCPKKKKKYHDPKDKFKKVQKDKKKAKKRGFYVQEESSSKSEPIQSSDEDIDDESLNEFMLMAI